MDHISVKFILSSKQKDITETTELMQNAFTICKDHIKDATWCHKSDIKLEQLGKHVYLIFDNITQDKDYSQLLETKCVILGPLALLVCLTESKPIPTFLYPMNNVAMYNCVVSCSNMLKDAKEDVQAKVQLMGGYYSNQLTTRTTHLITNTTRSSKYIVAAKNGIKIMLPTFIHALWDASRNRNVHANDVDFQTGYNCMPFQNLTVCATGIKDITERKRLAKVVNKNGGKFWENLKLHHTDILVCHESHGTSSEKYKAARSRPNIKCVTLEWIYDSLKMGYALSTDEYKVKKGTSTPLKQNCLDVPGPDFSILSAIDHEDISRRNTINNTVWTSVINENTTIKSPFGNGDVKNGYELLIDGIDCKKVKQSGHCLDGCSVYLVGFKEDELEKLRKPLNLSGATRYSTLSDRVTHVIVGDESHSDVKDVAAQQAAHQYAFSVVNLNWFLDSVTAQQPVNEEPYYVVVGQTGGKVEDNARRLVDDSGEGKKIGSPLSKMGISLLTVDKTVTNSPPKVGACNDLSTQELNLLPGQSTLAALAENDFSQSLNVRKPYEEQVKLPVDDHGDLTKNERTVSPAQITNNIEENEEDVTKFSYYIGLKFVLRDLPEEEIEQIETLITNAGGVVLANGAKGANVLVVPLSYQSPPSEDGIQIVTKYWVYDCLYQEKLIVDISYYHQPVVYAGDKRPLTNCVISVSGYAKMERTFLKDIIIELGGVFQNMFSRFSHPEKELLACTHLVTKEQSGKKYQAARNWGVPLITHEWLLDCALTGRKPSENQDNDSISNISNATKSSTEDLKENKASPTNPRNGDATLSDLNSPLRQIQANVEENIPKTPMTAQKKRAESIPGRRSMRPQSPITPINKVLEKARAQGIILQRTTLSDGDGEGRDVEVAAAASPCDSPRVYDRWNPRTPNTPYERFCCLNTNKARRKEMLVYLNTLPTFSPVRKARRESTPLSKVVEQMKKKLFNVPSDEDMQAASNYCESQQYDPGYNVSISLENDDVFENADGNVSYDKGNGINVNDKLLETKMLELENIIAKSSVNTSRRRSTITSYKPEPEIYSKPISTDPCSVGWDYMESQYKTTTNTCRIFMISGVDTDQRTELVYKIEQLGGTVSDLQSYDPNSTHLICLKLTKNEKSLASVAAGKWILHANYVEKSADAGIFLDEEDFEFGNPKSIENGPQYPSDGSVNADGGLVFPAWWRHEIKTRNYGAFHNMRAIIVSQKKEPLSRVIEAGGGVIVNVSPPFEDTVHATHCLLEKSVRDLTDYVPLAQQGIFCVTTMFINDYLHRMVVDHTDYILPYFQQYTSTKS